VIPKAYHTVGRPAPGFLGSGVQVGTARLSAKVAGRSFSCSGASEMQGGRLRLP